MSTMLRTACFAVLLAACGGGEGPASPPLTAAAPVPAEDAGRPNVSYGIEGTPAGLPVIAVNAAGVTVDGASLPSADVASIRKGKRSEGLVRALQDWKRTHATDAAAGRVGFSFDRDTPWAVIASVVGAAAHAGYPHAAFLTRLPKEGGVSPSHLDADIRIDKKKTTDRELHVSVSAGGSVMLKWTEGPKRIGDVVSTEAVVTRLAPFVMREWNERGLHHDANDRQLDGAVLHVDRDAPYVVFLVALDALHAPKRSLGGAEVPALNVSVDSE